MPCCVAFGCSTKNAGKSFNPPLTFHQVEKIHIFAFAAMDGILHDDEQSTENEKKEIIETFRKHKGRYFVRMIYDAILVMSGIINKSKIHLVFNIIFFAVHFFILANTVYITMFVTIDWELTAEGIYYLLIICVAVSFTLALGFNTNSIRNMMRKINNGVYHYGDTIDEETAKLIEITTKRMKKRKVWLMNGIEIIFNTFFFNCVAAFPAVAGKFDYKPDLVEKYSNYTTNLVLNSQALVVGFFPYDTRNWPGFLLCTFSEYYIAVTTLCLLDSVDLAFIGVAEEMCNELEVLNSTLRYTKRRARHVYKKKYGENAKSFHNEKLNTCLRDCLNDSVQHHMATISYFDDILNAYSIGVFFIVVTGAFLLCMCGIIFVSKRVKLALKLAFLLYLLGETTHVFIFSYYGEKINELSSATREMIYHMEWEDMNSKVLLPYISIMQSKTFEPMKLSAGGLIFCNFDTFGNVVSSAYSYFNLLSATTDL